MSLMNLQYIGLEEINGPLVFLDDVEGVGNEEMVEIRVDDGSVRYGRVVQIVGKRVAIQVFEGTNGISLDNTRATFTGHPVEMGQIGRAHV